MDKRELGAWLRQQREAHGWTRAQMANRLTRAANAHGDRTRSYVDSLCKNIYRWEQGIVSPSERYKLYYCHAFGISPAEYGATKAESGFPADGDLAMTILCSLAGLLGLRREYSGEMLIIRREPS